MASPTKVSKTRKKLKARKLGRDRKHHTARDGSTPTRAEFFGDVPKAQRGVNIER